MKTVLITGCSSGIGFASAREMAGAFERTVPAIAYEVRLSPAGDVYWLERRGEEVVRSDVEPGTSISQRTWVRLLSMLPIEPLL